MNNIETLIGLCSVRPAPNSPEGRAWELGACQGWAWAVSMAALDLPSAEKIAALIDPRAFDPNARWHKGEPRDRRRRNARQTARAILALIKETAP